MLCIAVAKGNGYKDFAEVLTDIAQTHKHLLVLLALIYARGAEAKYEA